MNIHQPVFLTTTTIILNVFILKTQAMNPSIGHTIVFVNYEPTWSQLVAPIVMRSQTP